MPDEPFRIKAHDRKPTVFGKLGFLGTATGPDLTGSVVTFILRRAVEVVADDGTVTLVPVSTGAPAVNAPATVLDPVAGTVRYDWQAGDTDTPGHYLAEWEVVDPDGLPQTFPTDSYNTFVIYADLDGAA